MIHSEDMVDAMFFKFNEVSHLGVSARTLVTLVLFINSFAFIDTFAFTVWSYGVTLTWVPPPLG
jgi:hypothetical protein